MNLTLLGHRALGASKLYLIKNGPSILTGAGILGFVGTTVLVGRAAVKAKPEIDAIKLDLQVVEARELDANYTRKKQGVDYATILMHAVRDIGKIYAPSVIVGGISITCIVSAHGMLKRQNAALVAAYSALDLGFKAYRKRVVEEFGEKTDRDFYKGIVGRQEGLDEEGRPCVIEELDGEGDTPARSLYGRYFDECSSEWSKNAEYNRTFLQSQQNYANHMLVSRGHLFLNEVYDMLGFERCRAGQIVGWKYYRDGKNPKGDNYVDFGLFQAEDAVSRAFINGKERVIFLDFNVDGPIAID